MHHSQTQPVLARRTSLVQYFEEHHVPPLHEEQQKRPKTDTKIAQHPQDDEEGQQDGGTDRQVDGKGQCARYESGRTQE